MAINLNNHSSIDGEYILLEPQPDKNLFPLYYRAQKIECTLNPGDILYLPKGWWHWIFSENETIAINFWFKSQFKTFGNRLELDIINDSIAKDIFQQEYLATNQPLLLRQAAIKQRAIALWKRDYLANKQDLIIPQFHSGMGQHSSFAPVHKPYFNNRNLANGEVHCDRNNKIKLFSQMPFQKLCDKINNYPELNYVAFVPLSGRSSLFADITTPSLLEQQNIHSVNFWYSYGNLHTGLHYDDYENILFLIKGKKRVFLYPPHQTQFLYSQPLPMLFNYVQLISI